MDSSKVCLIEKENISTEKLDKKNPETEALRSVRINKRKSIKIYDPKKIRREYNKSQNDRKKLYFEKFAGSGFSTISQEKFDSLPDASSKELHAECENILFPNHADVTSQRSTKESSKDCLIEEENILKEESNKKNPETRTLRSVRTNKRKLNEKYDPKKKIRKYNTRQREQKNLDLDFFSVSNCSTISQEEFESLPDASSKGLSTECKILSFPDHADVSPKKTSDPSQVVSLSTKANRNISDGTTLQNNVKSGSNYATDSNVKISKINSSETKYIQNMNVKVPNTLKSYVFKYTDDSNVQRITYEEPFQIPPISVKGNQKISSDPAPSENNVESMLNNSTNNAQESKLKSTENSFKQELSIQMETEANKNVISSPENFESIKLLYQNNEWTNFEINCEMTNNSNERLSKTNDGIFLNNGNLTPTMNFSKSEDKEEKLSIDVTYFKKCITNWKIPYPWIEYNEQNNSMYCSSCQLSCFPSCLIEDIRQQDIFAVSSILLNHSKSKIHCLLPIVMNVALFKKLYFVLKFKLYFCNSKSVLFQYMNQIIESHIGYILEEDILYYFIGCLAQAINFYVIARVKRFHYSGVSYSVDECKKILLARFLNEENVIEEHFMCDYLFYPYTLNVYLSERNMLDRKMIYTNYRAPCRNCLSCSNQPFDKSPSVNEVPNFSDILPWLKTDPYIGYYEKYIERIKQIAVLFKNEFHSVAFTDFICASEFYDPRLYDLIINSSTVLQNILVRIYRRIKDESSAEKCIQFYPVFSKRIKCMFEILFALKNCDVNVFSSDKISGLMTELRETSLENEHVFNIFRVIEMYINGTLRDSQKNSNQILPEDISILFNPRILADISSECYKNNVEKLFAIMRKSFNVDLKTFRNSLLSFGENLSYRCQTEYGSPLSYADMHSLILANGDQLICNLYSLINVLPLTNAAVKKSLFEAGICYDRYETYFHRELCSYLFAIRMEGFNPIILHSHVIENLRRKSSLNSQ